MIGHVVAVAMQYREKIFDFAVTVTVFGNKIGVGLLRYRDHWDVGVGWQNRPEQDRSAQDREETATGNGAEEFAERLQCDLSPGRSCPCFRTLAKR